MSDLIRLEDKVDKLTDKVTCLDKRVSAFLILHGTIPKRVRRLENTKVYVAGIVAAVAFLIPIGWAITKHFLG